MSYCKLEVFPKATSAICIAKLVNFSNIIAIAAACVSFGLVDTSAVEDPTMDPFLRVLSSAGSFIGIAIYGTIIFVLPFGLGGMGAGYLIEQERSMKNRTSAIGFVSGAIFGYVVLFGLVVSAFATTLVAAASGAPGGFVVGVVASSIRFGQHNR